MKYLKADTETKVVIGPVVAVGDGFTPVTNLALGTADEAEILKHDASAVTDISGNTFAAITSADGYYNLTLTAAQLDTEGRLTVLINDDSLCLPVRSDFMVVNANVFDSLFAAATTDYLQTDVTQISSDATAADNAELAFDGTGYGFTGCTVPWNASWDAEVQSEVNDALVATGLDHLVSAAVVGADVVDNSIVAQLVSKNATADWDTFVNTTDSLQALADNAAPSAATIADAVWDEDLSGHTGVGDEAAVDLLAVLTDTNRLEQALYVHDSTLQAGSTSTTAVLNAGASGVDELYTGQTIHIVSGAGMKGQSRTITAYNGTTKTATIAPAWQTTPTAGQSFYITVAGNTDVRADIATAQADLDTITGSDGVTLATAQANYAPATAAALATVDGIVDNILVDTAEIGAAGAGLTEAGGTGDHLTALPAVTANVTQFLGTTIVETTSGNIAANFDTFYDNANALTSQTVDDVGAGSGGSATLANQNAILAAIGNAALVQTNVLTGGKIILKKGDSHTKTASNQITLTQADTGAVMHARFQAADSIQIGFRLDETSGAANDIAGTIAKADVTEAGDVTTIVAEVTAAAMANATPGNYRYDIQRTVSSEVATELTGPAVLQSDNAE